MLNETEILQAKTRALNVINGFIRIRNQQATDVVSLAEALQEANRRLRELDSGQLDLAKPSSSLTEAFDEIFSNIKGYRDDRPA